ncbi:MAG: hypothetical protein ACREPM_02970 [Gemmatimonadaceae bacterium]
MMTLLLDAAADAADPACERVFARELPGGGEVVLEVMPEREGVMRQYHGRLVVERRTDVTRRRADERPVIAEVHGGHRAIVVSALFPIALSNTAIAVRLLRRSARES